MSEPQMMPLENPPADPGALTTMAQAMERMALMMRQAMAALNGVDHKVETQLGTFKVHLQDDVVKPLQERMSAIEAKQRDAILVDPNDRQVIKEEVAAKAREFGRERIHFARMYGRLHREFGVSGYEFLRKVDLEQALKYVRAYDGKRTTWAAY